MLRLFSKYQLLLFLLIAFHVFANVLWISLNSTPPTWDAALHTVLSIKFLGYIQTHLASFNLVEFLRISEYYPPLVHWVGAILAFLGNGDYKTIALSGTFFFAIAIYFLFLYTKELFQNERVAFFASFFFSFFLTIYQQSRDHMLDIPLTALVLVSLYFLKKSRLPLFFFMAGLAFLTKWYALLYLAIPFILNFRPSKKLLAGLGIFATITGPWYLINLQRFLEISRAAAVPEPANPQNLFSLQNWIFNLNLINNFQIGFVGLIFFVFSIIIFLKYSDFKNKILLLGTVLLNYFVFTVILTKNVRYTIPMMPFFAIIMAYGANYLWNKVRTVNIFLLLFYIFSFLILSFGFPINPSFKISSQIPVLGENDFLYLSDRPVKAIFDSNPWPNEKILADIAELSKDQKKIVLLNLSDRGYLNGYNLDPYLYNDLPSNSKKIQLFFLPFLEKYQDVPPGVNFALVPEKYVALPEGSKVYTDLVRFQKLFLNNSIRNFTVIKTYDVTGDYFHPELFPKDTLLLYKKQTPQN